MVSVKIKQPNKNKSKNKNFIFSFNNEHLIYKIEIFKLEVQKILKNTKIQNIKY